MTLYKWIETSVPRGLEIRQVYGFIFAPDHCLLVLENEGIYALPGGRPERDETMSQTLSRESLEEAQISIGSVEYLGYQYVKEENFAQVRMVALLDQLMEEAPDPTTGRQYRRIWVAPERANELLKWGVSGDQQIARAIAANRTDWSNPLDVHQPVIFSNRRDFTLGNVRSFFPFSEGI